MVYLFSFQPDYDDIEEEENRLGGVKNFPLTRNMNGSNNSNMKTKDKKYGKYFQCLFLNQNFLLFEWGLFLSNCAVRAL